MNKVTNITINGGLGTDVITYLGDNRFKLQYAGGSAEYKRSEIIGIIKSYFEDAYWAPPNS